ncbi:MAG TPA: T9SS type A sorting domain-containing protein [Chitinophagales bacterium]|nr:T9SS type A sorting domain-containing protein [Chitinophagales bacterium]
MKTKHILTTILCGIIWCSAYSTESEPNDTKAQANTLALNGSNTGVISPATTDVDWWKVITNKDGKLNVTLTISNGLFCWVELFDNNGTTSLAINNTNGTITIFKDGLANGTYFIKIYPYFSAQMPSYTISNTLDIAAFTKDVEPNGTVATALTLAQNATANGHCDYYYNLQRDTTDWYSITTDGDGLLKLILSSSNGQYIWAYLYDHDGTTLLASNNTNSSIPIPKDGLTAGTYYVKIIAYFPDGFAPYTLTDSLFKPTQANDAEPNDTKSQALTLGQNGSKTGHVDYYYTLHRDTTDWYKITTNADGLLTLTLTSGNGQYVWAYLYDHDGTTLLTSNNTNGSLPIPKDGLAAGTYYVKIKAYFPDGFVPYTLASHLTVPTEPNDAEPNGTLAQALIFAVNSTVTGHINYYYNGVYDSQDWYKIVTPADGMLNLTITSGNGQYIWAYLYDNDGVTLLDSRNTNGTISYPYDGLAAGTYYVLVTHYYPTGWAPYTLTNSLSLYTNANDGLSNDFAKLGRTLPANTATQGHVGFRNNGGLRDLIDWWKINYTGTGNLTVTLNWETSFYGIGTPYVWMYIYKDTALAPIYSNNSNAGILTANLTSLTQGYYYVKVIPYYNTHWAAYNINSTFTQTNCVTSVSATTTHVGTSCTNSYITFQVTGGLNQQLQLYRYGIAQGGKVFVDGTGSHKFDNLAPGNYYAVGLNDGATGTCQATSATKTVVPKPKNLSATNITSTTADVNWTTYNCIKYSYVQYRPLGATTWKKKTTTGNVSTYHLTGLIIDTTYEYHIAALDSSNGQTAIGKYSAISTFGTLPRLAEEGTASEVNLIVYPNPVASAVHVSFENGTEGEVLMKLFDVNGRTVFAQHQNEANGNVNEEIDLSALNTGVYALQIITADGSVLNQSIVKAKE